MGLAGCNILCLDCCLDRDTLPEEICGWKVRVTWRQLGLCGPGYEVVMYGTSIERVFSG